LLNWIPRITYEQGIAQQITWVKDLN